MITEPHTLTRTERDAIDAYDAWVEDDLPRGPSRLRTVAALIGIAATLAIGLAIGLGDRSTPRAEPTAVQPVDEATIRLVYGFRDDVDRATRDATVTVMRWRLRCYGLRESSRVDADVDGQIVVTLQRLTLDETNRVVNGLGRRLGERARFTIALEADDDELRDPDSGLGPTFDRAVFFQELAERAVPAASIALYPNPESWSRAPGDRVAPRFDYCPPMPGRPGLRGAIVHRAPTHSVAGITPQIEIEGKRARVLVHFDETGKEQMHTLSARAIDRRLCIAFDGRILARPIIMATLPSRGLRLKIAPEVASAIDASRTMAPLRLIRLGAIDATTK